MPFLDTKDPELVKALDEILDLNSNTEWVILGHVKQTYQIKVVEKGEGFSDMVCCQIKKKKKKNFKN